MLGHTAPPQPKDLSTRELQTTVHLGQLVRTQGTVQDKPGYNTGGADDPAARKSGAIQALHPARDRARPSAPWIRFARATRSGSPVSRCNTARPRRTTPDYELLVADIGDVVLIERPPAVPQPVIATGITVILLVGFFLWTRERRLRSQRRRLRQTYKLGEEILGASSAATILKRISEALPGIIGVTRVQLYVYNRTAKTLDAIEDDGVEAESISLSSPPGGTPAGAVACFHYRTLLVIPDIDRSPFPVAAKHGDRSPKSLLFVPMMAQSEVIGVLELDQDDRVRDFTADEQALAQHLGNQIGVAIRLLDQRTVQEQLFRTEKMAAVGRLISGVVNELQTPLASITNLAHNALEKAHGGAAEREVTAIAAEAAKAAGMVSRLVSFAAAEQAEARPVDITDLLRSLIDVPRRRLEGYRHPRARPDVARSALRPWLAGPVGAGLPQPVCARRAIAGRRRTEIDHHPHQRARQAPAGGDLVHLALGIAQAGGHGGGAGCDAQRDCRPRRAKCG